MDNDWTGASGHGNHGTAYNGATFSLDKRVGSYAGSFDGTDDYVSGSTADFPSGSSPRTLSAWVKVEVERKTGRYCNMELQATPAPPGNFRLYIDSSNRAAIGNGDGCGVVGGTSFRRRQLALCNRDL